MESMRDSFGRQIDYMRISITDRCNLRCRYCMPEDIPLLPGDEILTFEEIEMVCRAALQTGITKFKITGGEPLVRLGCPSLIKMIKNIPGTEQVTLTTNGILLGRYLDSLMESGVDGINISLDTLKPAVYARLTGYDKLTEVRDNIRKAVEAGLKVKLNSVLQKGINEEEWEALGALTLEKKLDVRFIEMMPIGYGKQCEGIRGGEVLRKFMEKYPGIRKDDSIHGNGPAVYYRLPEALGSIGFISAVHGQFCESCNRIRLTARGEESVDVKNIMRNIMREKESGLKQEYRNYLSIDAAQKAIREAIEKKPQMHCFEACGKMTEKRQMVQIGG